QVFNIETGRVRAGAKEHIQFRRSQYGEQGIEPGGRASALNQRDGRLPQAAPCTQFRLTQPALVAGAADQRADLLRGAGQFFHDLDYTPIQINFQYTNWRIIGVYTLIRISRGYRLWRIKR